MGELSETDSVFLLSWKHRLGWAAVAASDAQACFTCRNMTHKLGTKPSLLHVMVAVTYCVAVTYHSPRDAGCVFPSCKSSRCILC